MTAPTPAQLEQLVARDSALARTLRRPNTLPIGQTGLVAVFHSGREPVAVDPNTPIGADFISMVIPSVEQTARDPDTAPARLLSLIDQCPADVLQNPALPLLALSEPAAWRRIQQLGRMQLALNMLAHRASLPLGARRWLEREALRRAEPELKTCLPLAEVEHALLLLQEPERVQAVSHFDDLFDEMLTIHDFAGQGGGSPQKLGARLLRAALELCHRREKVEGMRDVFTYAASFSYSCHRADVYAAAQAELRELEAQVRDMWAAVLDGASP